MGFGVLRLQTESVVEACAQLQRNLRVTNFTLTSDTSLNKS